MNILSKVKHIILIGAAICCLHACTDDDESADGIKIGDTVPDFVLNWANGNTFNSVSDIDRTTLIAFFHTDCPDCQKELPILQQIHDSLGQSIKFILISRKQPESEIDAYWKTNGLTMPYCPQEDRTIYDKFAKSGIPRGYVVDRNRIVRYKFDDINMPSYDELRKQIEMIYE